jgi:hypothetical protein
MMVGSPQGNNGGKELKIIPSYFQKAVEYEGIFIGIKKVNSLK